MIIRLVHSRFVHVKINSFGTSATEFFLVVQNEGGRNVSRKVKCFNLDAIIAVGYRVNSKKATRFRQWETKILKEYIIKGFVLNDEMLR